MSSTKNTNSIKDIQTSIAPWLSVKNSVAAVEFYKLAFAAVELYRLDMQEGEVVAKLSIDGAEFWVSEGSEEGSGSANAGVSVRMILTVSDPDKLFARVLEAGAITVFPVEEGHGWRIGRLEDPFGHHWEIGYPLNN
jgi:PhnB protein